jgi:ADP-heptose:LPS heptosyltransferase
MFIENFKSYAKFFIRWRLLGLVRACLLFIFGHKPNKASWGDRVLVVNLHALGDIVAMTSVLRRYKIDFPHKKIYCLFPNDTGIAGKFFGEFADEIILIDIKKFGLNPLYELDFLNSLRDIGFETVVNQGYGILEIPSKVISVNIGAKNIIGYEGLVVEYVNADWTMRRRISFIKKSIFPRYTRIVPILDCDFRARGRVMSFPLIYAAIYKAFSGHTPEMMPTKIGIDGDIERSVRDLLKRRDVKLGTYGVFVIGGRTPVRWWPVDKFSEVAKEVNRSHIPIVLVGTQSEKGVALRFKELSNVPVVDLVGELSVAELVSVINNCLFVLTNDTAPVHIAIALKIPSVCIMGLGIFGVSDHYGYPRINRWAWEKTDCIFDYWRCIHGVGPGKVAPCIAAVTAEKVIGELRELLELIRKNDLGTFIGDDKFESEFESLR